MRDNPDVCCHSVNKALADLEAHDFEVTSIDGPEGGVSTYYEVTARVRSW